MKKKILSVALIAMSLVTFNGMAQSQAKENLDKNNLGATVCDQQCPAPQGECRSCCQGPFDGMNLSDVQKAKIKELNTKMQDSRRKQLEVRKDTKLRNDSLRRQERATAKKQYLEEVKSIIGPDNYVIFLENFYINGGVGRKDAMGNRREMMRPQGKRADARHHGFKGDKRGRHDGQDRHANRRPASTAATNS